MVGGPPPHIRVMYVSPSRHLTLPSFYGKHTSSIPPPSPHPYMLTVCLSVGLPPSLCFVSHFLSPSRVSLISPSLSVCLSCLSLCLPLFCLSLSIFSSSSVSSLFHPSRSVFSLISASLSLSGYPRSPSPSTPVGLIDIRERIEAPHPCL